MRTIDRILLALGLVLALGLSACEEGQVSSGAAVINRVGGSITTASGGYASSDPYYRGRYDGYYKNRQDYYRNTYGDSYRNGNYDRVGDGYRYRRDNNGGLRRDGDGRIDRPGDGYRYRRDNNGGLRRDPVSRPGEYNPPRIPSGRIGAVDIENLMLARTTGSTQQSLRNFFYLPPVSSAILNDALNLARSGDTRGLRALNLSNVDLSRLARNQRLHSSSIRLLAASLGISENHASDVITDFQGEFSSLVKAGKIHY